MGEETLGRTWHTAKYQDSFPVLLQVKAAAQIQYFLKQVRGRDIIFHLENTMRNGVLLFAVIWKQVSLCDQTQLTTKEWFYNV